MRDIYVDSRRRNEPYGNSYTLFLQTPLKNVTKAELISATVPNTLYNITNGINVFVVNSSNVYSIANGFYSASSLVDAVNKNIGGVCTLSFLHAEGKFMFTGSNAFAIDVLSDEFSQITGFESNLYSNLATTSNGIFNPSIGPYFAKSMNIANLKPCGEYIYLDIDELRRPFAIDAVTHPNESQSSTIFAVIPLDVNSGCIKTFKECTDYSISVEYPKPIDQIDRLTVRWLDYQGNLVNFNGVDENALLLRFYYSSQQTPEEHDENKNLPSSSSSFFMDMHKPTKRTVFVMLFVSLIFILFIKRK